MLLNSFFFESFLRNGEIMKIRFVLAIGLLAALSCSWCSFASATTIKVNGTTVFATDYEGGSATSLTFADALNLDTADLDPTTTLVGSWNTGLGGTGTFEKSSALAASYIVSSKQVQVANSTTGPDPGALQGSNYLRGFRNSSTYSTLWEASPASFVTDEDDLVIFSTAVYAPATTAGLVLTTLYNSESAFGIRARLQVNATGDIVTSTGSDTGLNFTYGQWKELSVSYNEGASAWSVTYDGNTATGLPLTGLGAGAVKFLSFGGGGGASAGTTIYFDAVPEPTTVAFAGMGLVGICVYGLRQRLNRR
jgi:hypothetical protein